MGKKRGRIDSGTTELAKDTYEVMTPVTYAFGAVILLLALLSASLLVLKPQINPLLTIFLYSIPSNCAISIFPHEPMLIFYGKTVNLLQLTAAATLGTVIAGYLDYRFFSPLLNLEMTSSNYRNRPLYLKAQRWFHRRPFITLLVAGFSPIPFFPFKFLTYASRYSLWRYLAALTISRSPRYYLLALGGFMFQIPDWIIIVAFVAMLLIVYHRKAYDLLRLMIDRGRRLPPAYSAENQLSAQQGLRDEPTGNSPDADYSAGKLMRIALHVARNLIRSKPLCVSIEVTHNCIADCRHCDKGARIEERLLGPAEYKRICDDLGPVLVQISGGEPLLREDLPDIVRALHNPRGLPFVAVITNGSLLTRERYLALREAGVNQFSISIDFPDARHDAFRRTPGLFDHLEQVVPELLAIGHDDVVLNCCIHRENYPFIPDIARKVKQWGAKLNFSTYTDLRTHADELNLRHPEDTSRLAAIIDEIYADSGEFDHIMTSERIMRRYCRFHERQFLPNCKAGHRFLVVNPDGRMTPCAMKIDTRYATRKELLEEFCATNSCGGCYISSRANTEKSAWELLTDNLRFLRLSRRSTA